MIRHARMIQSEPAEVGGQLNAPQAGYDGRIIVGTASTPAMGFVAEATDRVQRDHPRPPIGVESGTEACCPTMSGPMRGSQPARSAG